MGNHYSRATSPPSDPPLRPFIPRPDWMAEKMEAAARERHAPPPLPPAPPFVPVPIDWDQEARERDERDRADALDAAAALIAAAEAKTKPAHDPDALDGAEDEEPRPAPAGYRKRWWS